MSGSSIKKSVTVNATPETVWEILTQDDNVKQWAAAFHPGTSASTTRQEWALIERSVDGEVCVKWILTTYQPHKQMITTFYGGDPKTWFSDKLINMFESYTVTPDGEHSRLDIEVGPFSEEEWSQRGEKMITQRDNALMIIKNLAEKVKESEYL